MFFVLLLYALFASVFTVSKTGLEYTQPVFFVGARMLVAGLLMVAYQLFVQKESFVFSRKQFWRLVRLAVFNIYLTNIFEFWGLKYLTSFKTCFIYSLSPFVSAFFSYLMFSEKITGKKWLGLVIGMLGFIPILIHENATEQSTRHFFFLSWAEISVMGAAVSSVYGWILLRQLVKEDGLSPFKANGWAMLFGGAIALFHSYFTEDWNPMPVTETVPFLECAIALIIISNIICYNLYGFLLRRFTATFMSFAGFTTPLFTALFGWFYLGEVVSPPFYLSAAIVFLGLLLFYQEELKQGYQVRPELQAG